MFFFREKSPFFLLPLSRELPAFAVTWQCRYYGLRQRWVWAHFVEFSLVVWSGTIFIFAFDTVLLQQDLKVIPSGWAYNCLLLRGAENFQTQFRCRSLKAHSQPACAWKEDRQIDESCTFFWISIPCVRWEDLSCDWACSDEHLI